MFKNQFCILFPFLFRTLEVLHEVLQTQNMLDEHSFTIKPFTFLLFCNSSIVLSKFFACKFILYFFLK